MARGRHNPEGTVSAAEWPKYNFQMSDLDNVLVTLWAGPDIASTHERERVQFHFLLDVFCWSGARIGAFFRGGGLKYKVSYLSLSISLSSEVVVVFTLYTVAYMACGRMSSSCSGARTWPASGM